ncbi:hypothetical protein MJH12_13805, partial [bacterium]|nr:hypothetical protein [bacterium]
MKLLTYFQHICLVTVFTTYLSAMGCINGGDSHAHFQYSGILADENGQNLSGFQNIEMRFELYSSSDGDVEDYSQTFASVEVQDGTFVLDVGPCLPNLSASHFAQLSINNESLSSRTQLITLPLSINSLNSQKLSGMTSQELFLKINDAINLVLSDFSSNSFNPALDTLTQGLQNHQSNTSNPHIVTKSQIGLSQVDDVQQLALSALEINLNPISDINVPSSKAVAAHVSSQIAMIQVTGFELENPNLVAHLSRVDNPHSITRSQLNLEFVSNVLQ